MRKKIMAMALGSLLFFAGCGTTTAENSQDTAKNESSESGQGIGVGVDIDALFQTAMERFDAYDSLVGENIIYYHTTVFENEMEEIVHRRFEIVNDPVQMHIATTNYVDGNQYDETTYYEGEGDIVNVYYDSYSEKWYVQQLDFETYQRYQTMILQTDIIKKSENLAIVAEAIGDDGVTQYGVLAELSWQSMLDMAENNGSLESAAMMGITKDDLLEILHDKETPTVEIVIDENGFLQSYIFDMQPLMQEIMFAVSGDVEELFATFERAEVHVRISGYDTIDDIAMTDEMRETAELIG